MTVYPVAQPVVGGIGFKAFGTQAIGVSHSQLLIAPGEGIIKSFIGSLPEAIIVTIFYRCKL
jgi:hypothetical protein